jgi:hypothetical protein
MFKDINVNKFNPRGNIKNIDISSSNYSEKKGDHKQVNTVTAE